MLIFLIVIAFYGIFIDYNKEMNYYRVEFSVEVLNSKGGQDTLNFNDSLCLSRQRVRIIYSPRISRNVLSLQYRDEIGYKDTLIVEDILKYTILKNPEVTLIGDCLE